jgi:F0F1-type ATP synthase alpha subunit
MTNPLIEELKKELSQFHHVVERESIGTVLEVGDGVARARKQQPFRGR